MKAMQRIAAKLDLNFQGRINYEEEGFQHLVDKDFSLRIRIFQQNYFQQEENDCVFQVQKNNGEVWVAKETFNAHYYFSRQQFLSISLFSSQTQNQFSWTGRLIDLLSNDLKVIVQLKNDQKVVGSSLRIKWKEVYEIGELDLMMDWRATQLAKVGSGFLSVTNPYLRFLRGMANETFVEAAKTEIKNSNITPDWKQFVIPIKKIFDLSLHLPYFKVQCWHAEKQKQSVLIGQARVEFKTFKKFSKEDQNQIFIMKNHQTKQNMGNLILEGYDVLQPESFIRLFSVGLKFTFTAAFTFSEKNKKQLNLQKSICQLIKQTWGCIEPLVQEFQNEKTTAIFGVGLKLENQKKYKYQILCDDESSSDEEDEEEVRKTRSSSSLNYNFLIGNDAQIPREEVERTLEKIEKLGEQKFYFEEQIELVPFIQEVVDRVNAPKNPQSYHLVQIIVTQDFLDFQEAMSLIALNYQLPVSFLFIGINLDKEIEDKFEILNKGSGKKLFQRQMTYFINIKEEKGQNKQQEQEQELVKEQKMRIALSQIPYQTTEYMQIVEMWENMMPLMKKRSSLNCTQ